MSSTWSGSDTETFTLTHAQKIAAKVATDLKRIQRFYGAPTDEWIDKYDREMAVLLKYDAVKEVVYGFQRHGKWTEVSLKYVALPGGTLRTDDDPGKLLPGLDTANATFTSYLTYNERWSGFTSGQKETVDKEVGFPRSTANEPTLEAGYWSADLNYLGGGRGLGRSVVKK